MFQRNILQELKKRLSEPRRFIQVLVGPRQTGKTTLARQAMSTADILAHYATADEPALKSGAWLEQQWETARALTQPHTGAPPRAALLVLDEIQKLPSWSETVKRCWDEDTASNRPLHVILLGSSPLLVQRGLTETLAGRFEVLPVSHWSYLEMRDAFGWDLDTYLYYGGYPGAVALVEAPERWSRYILDSLIETSISRDIFLMTRVDKPALLRTLFELGCAYSGQIVSYQKMLGQLHDAGNTTTLAHYLDLLEGAGMIRGLKKYSGQKTRQRASSPKLLALNTALMTAMSGIAPTEMQKNPEFRGRLTESAVGATLANGGMGHSIELFYWNAGNHEVDFVMKKGGKLVAIEVKSGRRRETLSGIEAFRQQFNPTKNLLVGADGIPLQEFFVTPPTAWFD